jgi:hypothetical protein
MDEKITIIEGPPPTFEAVSDGWALGLNEGPSLADVAVTPPAHIQWPRSGRALPPRLA